MYLLVLRINYYRMRPKINAFLSTYFFLAAELSLVGSEGNKVNAPVIVPPALESKLSTPLPTRLPTSSVDNMQP